ncbi:MAG: TIGR01777 family protein [Acidobacteria bacterium]|nr:TIGR01777 family protein [Acidobacteriota bacterium]
MNIVVTGGSGFLGSALTRWLASQGHDIVILTRSLPDGQTETAGSTRIRRSGWTLEGDGRWMAHVQDANAVVNLAGESIGEGRWTATKKRRIHDSRVAATRQVIAAIERATRPPQVLISGSAVGYYGDRAAERLTESSSAGHDVLARVCIDWEREAARAEPHGVRTVLVRTGLVLDRAGGALQRMLLPFRLFGGGPLGSGRQYWSWIHREDWVALVNWALEREDLTGPVNATAPHPVTNAEFSTALGRVLRRPSWLPAPAFALRLALGEMAEALLLGSQRVIPERALDRGFEFRYREVDAALKEIFERL